MARRRATGFSISFFAFQDIITSVVGIFVLITLVMMINLVAQTATSQPVASKTADLYSDAIQDLEKQLAVLIARSNDLDKLASSVGTVQLFNKEDIVKELTQDLKAYDDQIERTKKRNFEIQQLNSQQSQDETQLQIEMNNRSPDREELAALMKELDKLDTKVDQLKTDIPLVYKSQVLEGRRIVVLDIAQSNLSLLDLDKNQRVTLGASDSASSLEKWLNQNDVGRIHFMLLIRPQASAKFLNIRNFLDSVNASYGYDVLDDKRSVRLRNEVEQE
jgi:hypothetical protein